MIIVVAVIVLIVLGALVSYFAFRPATGHSSLKPEKTITGEVERIGPFNSGSRKQDSFILRLKNDETSYYAHPNFGKSAYQPTDFVEMNKQLALTQADDLVELVVTTLKKTDGTSEQLILKFKNTKL